MWLSTVCILLCSTVAQGMDTNRRSLQEIAFKTTKNLKRSNLRGAAFKWIELRTQHLLWKLHLLFSEKGNVYTTLGQSRTFSQSNLIACFQEAFNGPKHTMACRLFTASKYCTRLNKNDLEDRFKGWRHLDFTITAVGDGNRKPLLSWKMRCWRRLVSLATALALWL